MKLSSLSVPCLYKNTYTDQFKKDFLLVYNPFSLKGLTVLNKEALFLFSLIDGKKNIGEILRLVGIS
ncbi:hypothetical protein ACFL0Y_02820, partial [Patescibacteria group bacterium]